MECESTSPALQAPLGRRTFFQWLTYGLSAIAAGVLSMPLIGYFVGVRKRDVHWVSLDEVERFPINETRLQTFDNPLTETVAVTTTPPSPTVSMLTLGVPCPETMLPAETSQRISGRATGFNPVMRAVKTIGSLDVISEVGPSTQMVGHVLVL